KPPDPPGRTVFTAPSTRLDGLTSRVVIFGQEPQAGRTNSPGEGAGATVEWSAEQVGRAYLIRLQGEFDEEAADRFRAHVDALLEQGGLRDLIVVMREVTFIDSSGLGAL